jgi:hypothetical protein
MIRKVSNGVEISFPVVYGFGQYLALENDKKRI